MLDGYATVVAVGGEGTYHEAINGIMAASEAGMAASDGGLTGTLGVLPVGSGCDFASMVGVSPTLEEACAQLARHDSGPYCIGQSVTLADVVLVPQVFNAFRFDCPMEEFPRIRAVYDACMAVAAFRDASPQAQADYGEPT